MQKLHGLTRREFLKLISLIPVGIYSRPVTRLAQVGPNINTPEQRANIIIIVFDAWSQHHVSFHGYPRQTMPNLEKFAQKATIYHNHYSPGTFTVPGTSSILTGLHPWSHRALQLGAGVISSHIKHNIFAALASTHSSLVFAQNKLADQILYGIEKDLDQHIKTWRFNVQDSNIYDFPFFNKDIRIAFASLDDNMVQKGEGFDSSLFFGPLYRLKTLRDRLRVSKKDYADNYPRGLPESPGYYLLDDIVDGAIDLLKGIEGPTLSYIHFWPPHHPYSPTKPFFDSFMDGWNPPDKPVHALSEEKNSAEKMHMNRRYYDEFIASWDHEVARLFQYLQESGLMENSYIIVTSDHGELFERGEIGHGPKLIYDPLIHVPLMISRPGQTRREDVHAFTSSVDLLPTLAHLTGSPIPEWAEGKILPQMGGEEEDGRSLFSMDARTTSSFGPLENYSVSITRDHHRLVSYHYPNLDYQKFEFYDLQADAAELNDLAPSQPALFVEMKNELLQKLDDVNRPYRHD